MALNSLNTLILTRDITLTTKFAADQLHLIAKKDSLVIFMAVLADIFGVDIPGEAYQALYNDAQKKAAILYPVVEVVGIVPQGAKACFDSETQIISVAETAVMAAVNGNDARGELMTMLIEEYGHYLDYLLRHHYAVTENTDAEGDEGAKFTYSLYTINPIENSDQYFADVTINGQPLKMTWDFSALHNDLKKHVNESRQQREDRTDNLEFFKAGILEPHGEFGHQDIIDEIFPEIIKAYVNPTKIRKTVDTIYLGNWLRDFSQAVDPMIVRPMSSATVITLDSQAVPGQLSEKTTVKTQVPEVTKIPSGTMAKLNPYNYVTNRTVEFRPVMLSVEAITTIIELAATKEFIHKKGMSKDGLKNYQGHVHKLRTEYIAITPETLGAYRPEEHIDNPKGVGQTASGGNRGDKELYDKFVGYVPDNHPMHGVNRDYGLKNYIRSNQQYVVDNSPYLTSYAYIVQQLKKSGKSGGLEKPKVLVDFGAAMHTLEDYFAHTNYVEISLIKSVEPMVFPWVDEVAEPTGFKYQYEQLFKGKGLDQRYILLGDKGRLKSGHELASYIPIVTGTFGLVDTAASVLPILNEHFFSIEFKPWEKSEPGERTFADILIRELLADIDRAQQDIQGNSGSNDSTFVDSFDLMLTVRDMAMTVKDYLLPDVIARGFYWITQHVKQLLNFTNYFLIRNIAATLNDAQVMLGKDLDAMEVGQFHIGIDPSHTQIAKDDPDHPLHELAGLLAVEAVKRVGEQMLRVWNGQGSVEANVIPVLDKLVRHPSVSDWQDPIVKAWAAANPGKVCAACSPSIIVDRMLHSIGEIDETMARLEKYLEDETVTGKVVGFFANEKEAREDINRLKTSIQRGLKTSQVQRSRAKAIKVVWDAKYSKPAYCKIGGAVTEHKENEHTKTNKPQTQDKTFQYKIKKGDTLWAIAKQYNTTVDALKALNGLTSDMIYAGRELKVPVEK